VETNNKASISNIKEETVMVETKEDSVEEKEESHSITVVTGKIIRVETVETGKIKEEIREESLTSVEVSHSTKEESHSTKEESPSIKTE
jgi:hypothetical protein